MRDAVPGTGPTTGECTVWWAGPVDPALRRDLVALLDEHERTRLRAFRRPDDAGRYLAAHALTRIVLGERTATHPAGVRFDRTCRCGAPHGKPRLAPVGDGGPEFSFTHSGDLVGLAVADVPVGLDVEHHRALSDVAGMAEHVSSPAEKARPAPATTGEFLRVWTRKEALLKATGDGLSRPMDSITLSPPGHPPAVLEWTGEGAPVEPFWLVDLAPRLHHPAAVAGAGAAAPRIVEHDGDAVLHARAARA
ncbi:4'-phosphopantetheinyl transferase [Pseudonocardia dioxanivorans CB1190]|uniref:4'-phosphopantetheinyl transferase n=1 Tax=Pseudonocardia dioxanivorans (strain ATCC 55486 / DSM 44775 / JCM 13855 / CB1190) TaxID=675635 RepID=F4CJI6_PSEUX|nr:4'-phosphopantetheinyl transferase superfamily protein [Pseudonocardia dioxanivorans]AEA24938.1 4'-phosphopantetheinyl transferase [Pseudonocardia dioxanivorans CB1190]